MWDSVSSVRFLYLGRTNSLLFTFEFLLDRLRYFCLHYSLEIVHNFKSWVINKSKKLNTRANKNTSLLSRRTHSISKPLINSLWDSVGSVQICCLGWTTSLLFTINFLLDRLGYFSFHSGIKIVYNFKSWLINKH